MFVPMKRELYPIETDVFHRSRPLQANKNHLFTQVKLIVWNTENNLLKPWTYKQRNKNSKDANQLLHNDQASKMNFNQKPEK